MNRESLSFCVLSLRLRCDLSLRLRCAPPSPDVNSITKSVRRTFVGVVGNADFDKGTCVRVMVL